MLEPEQPTVYRPHPKKDGVFQCFKPIITINEKKGKKEIDFGKSLGDYRRAGPGEKSDIELFDVNERRMVGYVRIDA